MENRVLQVLIAEDDSVLADVLQFNLQRAGFAVTTVESGDAAVEQLRTGTFDLLISDFQMPGLTGEQVCQVAREELKLTDLPILLCTAKGLEIDAEQSAIEVQHGGGHLQTLQHAGHRLAGALVD